MNVRRLAATGAAAATNLGSSLSFLVVRRDHPDAGGMAASAFVPAGGPLALPALPVALHERRLVVLDADNAAIADIAALIGFMRSPLRCVRVAAALAGPPPRRLTTRAAAAM